MLNENVTVEYTNQPKGIFATITPVDAPDHTQTYEFENTDQANNFITYSLGLTIISA